MITDVVVHNSGDIVFPIAGGYHLTRGCLFTYEDHIWTEYKSKNGITIKVHLVMDEETRAAVAVLAKKADEALKLQLGREL